ncbi:MAG: phasin family protein [Xanthobacteraceae bacterium]
MTEQQIAGGEEALRHSPHIDIPDGVKQATAASINQVREGYEKFYGNAEAMTDAVERSYAMAMTDTADLHGKILQTIQANLVASFEFATALVGARSLPEMIALSTKFAQQQFETYAKQTKDFWSFGQKMISDTAKPVTSGLSRLDRTASS